MNFENINDYVYLVLYYGLKVPIENSLKTQGVDYLAKIRVEANTKTKIEDTFRQIFKFEKMTMSYEEIRKQKYFLV